MILVDTSIWIEFFKKKEPIFAVLKNLLENSEVFVPEIVFGELLQGCKSKYEEGILLEYWQNLNKLPNDKSFIEAGRYSFSNKYFDKGIGLIDSVLIYQVKKNQMKLWTLDKKIIKALTKNELYSI